MSIEFTIQTVQIDQQELQEYLPALVSMVDNYLPKKKTLKRRKRKPKQTVGPLIQQIIDDIEK